MSNYSSIARYGRKKQVDERLELVMNDKFLLSTKPVMTRIEHSSTPSVVKKKETFNETKNLKRNLTNHCDAFAQRTRHRNSFESDI